MSSPYLEKPKRTLEQAMAEREKLTTFYLPRAKVWQAMRSGAGDLTNVGSGPTEQAAIADLLRKEQENNDG